MEEGGRVGEKGGRPPPPPDPKVRTDKIFPSSIFLLLRARGEDILFSSCLLFGMQSDRFFGNENSKKWWEISSLIFILGRERKGR